MEINGIEFLGIEVQFNGYSKQDVIDSVHTFDFGTLTLRNGSKEIILDTDNPIADGYSIKLDIIEHPDMESKNDLPFVNRYTEIAELYIGTEYEIEPDSITLFVKQGGCTQAIELNQDK